MSNNSDLDKGFFGHPKGLQTLFFTEMWERMSYYGMRALLVLFLTLSLQDGGIGIEDAAIATSIYGLYTGFVYLMGLPGGWMADRLIGGQKAIWYGGIVIMCGHIALAIPSNETFFLGLVLLVLGTGMLKPNITAAVGQLYKRGDARIEAGYALYYMGINIGSVIGYTVCGYFYQSESFGPHWAFGAAAIGMFFGLVQFKMTKGYLQGVASEPISPLSPAGAKKAWLGIYAFLAVVAAIFFAAVSGALALDPRPIADAAAYICSVLFFAYFGKIFFFGDLNGDEKRKMLALLLVCIGSVCFWVGFEQAGSSLNLFANEIVDRTLGSFTIPTAWFQSANPFFIIALSPFMAALWVKLGQKMVSPAFGIKAAVGILIMASGFIVMFYASQKAAAGLPVAASFLIATYFLHTVGELCLSPVALSAVSKLSPKRFAGQMMGVFVLTYAIGNIIAGKIAGGFDSSDLATIPPFFLDISILCIGFGLVILVAGFVTRKWEIEKKDEA